MGDINAINSAGTLAALISNLSMPSGVYDPVGRRLLVNSAWSDWSFGAGPAVGQDGWHALDDVDDLSKILPDLSTEIQMSDGYYSRTETKDGKDVVLFLSLIHI